MREYLVIVNDRCEPSYKARAHSTHDSEAHAKQVIRFLQARDTEGVKRFSIKEIKTDSMGCELIQQAPGNENDSHFQAPILPWKHLASQYLRIYFFKLKTQAIIRKELLIFAGQATIILYMDTQSHFFAATESTMTDSLTAAQIFKTLKDMDATIALAERVSEIFRQEPIWAISVDNGGNRIFVSHGYGSETVIYCNGEILQAITRSVKNEN